MSIEGTITSALRLKNGYIRIELSPLEKNAFSIPCCLEITNYPKKARIDVLLGIVLRGERESVMIGDTKWGTLRNDKLITLVRPPKLKKPKK